jgi:hypothetical protein
MKKKNKRHAYTAEQIEFLRINVKGRRYSLLAKMFNQQYDTTISKAAIEQFCRSRGMLNGLNDNRPYTREQVQFLRDNVKGKPYTVLTELFNQRFGTSVRYINICHACSYHGLSNGLKGGFKQGHTTNVGRRFAHNMPEGTEIIKSNGYTVVKINEGWRGKHVIIWEAAHGPVPSGYHIVFGDGDRTNFALENLHCIPVAHVGIWSMRRLTGETPELAAVGIALTGLYAKINERKKKARG